MSFFQIILRRLPRRFPGSQECADGLRDDVLMTPHFQVLWWIMFLFIVIFAIAAKQQTEYAIMVVMAYVIFTLPCLRWCCLWTRLYQARRSQTEPEEENEVSAPVRQVRKSALTEDETVASTREKQAYRAKVGTAKVFSIQTAKARRENNEDNGAIISELKIRTF